MSKYDNDVLRVVQLGVLSALVDGQASPQEIETLAAAVASQYGKDVAAVKTLATRLTEQYTKKKFADDPVAVVRQGTSAMRRLSGRNRRIAIDIATRVAASVPGGEASEATFLRSVHSMSRA